MSIDEYVTCTGWFKVLMTEFIVVSGRKDGVDLVLIYRHVVIFGSMIWTRKTLFCVETRSTRVKANWNIHRNMENIMLLLN